MVNKLEQYEVIIIGSGETGRDAIATLEAQGKKAMLIDLNVDTIATLIHQSQLQQESSSHATQHSSTDADEETNPTYISVQENMLTTPANQTITYTFHLPSTINMESLAIDEEPKENEVDEENDLFSSQESEEENDLHVIFQDLEDIELLKESVDETAINFDEDLEVIEPEPVEATEETIDLFDDTHPINPLIHWSTKKHRQLIDNQPSSTTEDKELQGEEDHIYKPRREGNLRDKLIRRKFVSSEQQDDQPQENQSFSFPESVTTDYDLTTIPNWEENHLPLRPAKIVKAETNTEIAKSEVNAETEEEKDSFLHTLLGEPVQMERESRLRKRFMNKQRIENQVQETPPFEHKKTEQPILEQKEETEYKKPSLTQTNNQEKDHSSAHSDVLKIGQTSGKRRTRTKKKKRMLNKNESLFETKSKINRHKPFTVPPTVLSDTKQPNESLYDFDPSSIQPFKQPPQEKSPYEQIPVMEQNESVFENTESITSQNNDSLKRDSIDFEEPYGYNSWDEFVTPGNNRKRQELNEVEKRKIALRGLHNLINNLG